VDRAKDLRELCELWDKAEKHLKRAEQQLAELVLPAANQLRYAGYHVARSFEALESRDESEYEKNIDKATNHCKRAMYDASEALFEHFHARISRFRDDYAQTYVTPILPDYLEILGRARRGRSIVLSTDSHNRDGFHEEAIRCCDDLQDDCERLDIAREELNKVIRAERRKSANFLIGIAVTVIVGALGMFATIYAARVAAPAPTPQPGKSVGK
jgi:hypothetical protein